MTEHGKLKWICDTIGYESDVNYDTDGFGRYCAGLGYGVWNYYCFEQADVREIIFTTEFRILFMGYLQFIQSNVHFDSVMEHLDDPVSYLYNLLGGQTHESK